MWIQIQFVAHKDAGAHITFTNLQVGFGQSCMQPSQNDSQLLGNINRVESRKDLVQRDPQENVEWSKTVSGK